MSSKKKSASQIRRMKLRAESRGDEYVPVPPSETVDNQTSPPKAKVKQQKRQRESSDSSSLLSKYEEARVKAMFKYEEEMKKVEANESLNSKTRRSAKRRAEAIALEASQIKMDDGTIDASTDLEDFSNLKAWYDQNMSLVTQYQEYIQKKKQANDKKKSEKAKKPSRYPYILFFGQIPFTTTTSELKDHLEKHMGSQYPLSDDTLQIRIPAQQSKAKKNVSASDTKENTHNDDTDDYIAEYDNAEIPKGIDSNIIHEHLSDSKTQQKSKRNRGYAFCEFTTTELYFAALKLHHTNLNGRRINVYRTAGGGKASRLSSQEVFKEEQQQSLNQRLQDLLQEYIQSGKLSEGELDDQAIMICQRRDVATVENALKRYIELKKGRELQHASAFFTKLLSEMETDQGITDYVERQKDKKDSEPNWKKRKTNHKNVSSKVFVNFGKTGCRYECKYCSRSK